MKVRIRNLLAFLVLCFVCVSAAAGERPYLRDLRSNYGRARKPGDRRKGPDGLSPRRGRVRIRVSEFEYGVKGWWTTEFYLDGQTTANQSTIFTGYRWENRFRLLMHEHKINPVLYVEYEDVNGADKSLLEVVGFDSQYDGLEPNKESSKEREREIETRLILSSNLNGWNISENFIAVKNLAGEPWEFGYSVGFSRPLALLASANECVFCRENFQAGVEFYGGLGTANKFTLHNTSQYIAPVLAWQIHDTTVKISPTVGLTSASYRVMLRFGVSYEFPGFGRRVANMFRR